MNLFKLLLLEMCIMMLCVKMNYAQNVLLGPETFTSGANFSTTNGSKFWSPSTCTGGPLQYYSTGGCTGGFVGIMNSTWNNYNVCFLRTPPVNCTGQNTVTMSFDVITSQHTGDYMTFSMWANNKYINAVSVNGTAGYTLKYDQVRNCVKTTVTYDLTNVTDKSAIYFYFNPYCSHNDNSPFNAGFDNIQIGGDINTNCTAPTLTVKANGLSQITACKGDPVALTANPAGGENCSGSWEYTWYNGSNYWTGFSFNSSTEAWSSDFQNINISSIQSSANFTVEVRCDGDYSCTAQSSSFSVQVDDCIGINSAVDNSGIRIYSALENVFTINLTGNNLQTEIFVYNITGRMVNNAVMQPNTSKVFNLSAYTKGVYYFSIINNKVRLTKRIIII